MSDTGLSSQSPTFSASDVTLLEALRAGASDFDIATRIGQPEPWVKRRIAFLSSQLGVAGRNGLAAWQPVAEPTHAAPPAPRRPTRVVNEPEVHQRRVSRRAIIGAGAIAAVAAGGGVFLKNRGGSTAPVSPARTPAAPSPTAEATTVTPTPTPTVDVSKLIVDAFDWVEKVSYTPGQLIDSAQGIFFMDTESGAIEGVRIYPERAPQLPGPFFYNSNSDNQRVTLQVKTGGVAGRHFLMDRATGRSLTWQPKDISLVCQLPDDHLLFEETRNSQGESREGRFHLVRAGTNGIERVSGFELQVAAASREPLTVVSADGKSVFFTSVAWGPVPTLFRFEIASGTVSTLYPATEDAGPGRRVQFRGLQPSEDGRGVVVYVDAYASEGGGARPTPRTSRAVGFTWAGQRREASALSAGESAHIRPGSHISPDGRLIAMDEPVRYVPSGQPDGGELWPAISVSSGTSRVASFRIRGAAIASTPFIGHSPWLADSSGFVARVLDEQAPSSRATWEREAVVFISADGSGIERLPEPPGGPENWTHSERSFGPLPATHDANLLSYGGVALYDRARGTWREANLPKQTQLLADPWRSASKDMVFILPGGSVGFPRPGTPVLLPANVQRPPITAEPTIELAARPATGAKLWSGFETESSLLATIPAGATVALSELPAGKLDLDRRAIETDRGSIWIHVTHGGNEGWIDSNELRWA